MLSGAAGVGTGAGLGGGRLLRTVRIRWRELVAERKLGPGADSKPLLRCQYMAPKGLMEKTSSM